MTVSIEASMHSRLTSEFVPPCAAEWRLQMIMKRSKASVLKGVALIVICLSLIFSLVSCSNSAPDIEEIRERVEYLIEGAFEINEIFFGNGLPIDEGGAVIYGEVEGYDYVSNEAKYRTVIQIKEAAEKIYSADYLEYIYDTVFQGYADPTVGIITARFIEENGELLQSSDNEPLYNGVRKYDYSTMKIVRPSNSSIVNIDITAWIEGAELPDTSYDFSDEYNDMISGQRHTVRLTLVKQNGEWYLDTPTY